MSRTVTATSTTTTAALSSSSASASSNNTNSTITNILDRPLAKTSSLRSSSNTTNEFISLSMFGYLFSEMVQYYQNRVDSIHELEHKLESCGYQVGIRILELFAFRNREYKREIKLMNILQFISTTVWKNLFGKPADSLEKSIDHIDEFMIVDYSPITSAYVSIPSDFNGLSIDSYISGIIAGILEGSGCPARVTAHSVSLEDGESSPNTTTTGSTNNNTSGSTTSSNMNNSGGTSSGMNNNSIENLPIRREKAVFLLKFAPSVLARDTSIG